MDQILGYNVSISVQVPEAGQGGVFARFNPLPGIVDKFFASFIDVNLFVDSGRSLYVWRKLMYTLAQYQITNEKTYLDIERDVIQFLEVASHSPHIDIARGTDLTLTNIPVLLGMMRYKPKLFDLLDSSEVHCFLETSASEYLFVLIKNSDYLSQVTDTNKKRIIGNFLVHALNIERDEYNQIKSFAQTSIQPLTFYDTSQSHDDTFLEYMSFETQENKTKFQDIVENLVNDIQNFRDINIKIINRSNSRSSSSNSSSSNLSSSEFIRLSPWFIVAACRVYLVRQSIWGQLDHVLTHMFDENADIESSSPLDFQNYSVFGIEKRMSESCLKLCLFERFLPNSVGEYESMCSSLRVSTSPQVMKLLYDIPFVVSWGCCVDRYSLIDETFRLNVRKVLSITKDEIETVLEKNGINIRELTTTTHTMDFAHILLQNAETHVKGMIQRTLQHTIGSAMVIFENEIYKHFFSLGHVANVTLPLLFSIFIESEFLSYADSHTPLYARNLMKYMLYALFPLMLSSTTETQYQLKHLFYDRRRIVSGRS